MTEGELCGESEKTKKAKEKLKKRLQLLEQKITQESLNKKSIEIHNRIGRYAQSRAVLKNDSMALFNNNQNPAEMSEKTRTFTQIIQENNKVFQVFETAMENIKDSSENLN